MAIVRDVMTPNPVSLPESATLAEAARAMKEADVGAIIITDGDQISGIVTDRDLVTRGMAEGKDPKSTRLGEVYTQDIATLDPQHSVEDAAHMMAENSIFRLPVVAEGQAVGIISLADLAPHLQPGSELAEIHSSKAKY